MALHPGKGQPETRASLSWHSLHDMPTPERLALLSSNELQRAGRFVFERDRRRYLAARCALRERLSWHTGVAPDRLRIAEDEHGKPFLTDVADCRFNVSHSEDVALVAISGVGEIGVDIEMLRPIPDAEQLAQSHFLPAELGEFLKLEGSARDAAFLRCWTRKEACLKALGTGLRVAPNGVAVGLGEEPVRVAIALPAGTVLVDVRSVTARTDCIAAVATMCRITE
jgi:4'-phosphopantetheinyl transferase